MNDRVYLDLPILQFSEIVMHEFLYDYVKPKIEKSEIMLHGQRQLIVYIKTEDIFVDIPNDVETRIDTSNYE